MAPPSAVADCLTPSMLSGASVALPAAVLPMASMSLPGIIEVCGIITGVGSNEMVLNYGIDTITSGNGVSIRVAREN